MFAQTLSAFDCQTAIILTLYPQPREALCAASWAASVQRVDDRLEQLLARAHECRSPSSDAAEQQAGCTGAEKLF